MSFFIAFLIASASASTNSCLNALEWTGREPEVLAALEAQVPELSSLLVERMRIVNTIALPDDERFYAILTLHVSESFPLDFEQRIFFARSHRDSKIEIIELDLLERRSDLESIEKRALNYSKSRPSETGKEYSSAVISVDGNSTIVAILKSRPEAFPIQVQLLRFEGEKIVDFRIGTDSDLSVVYEGSESTASDRRVPVISWLSQSE